MTLRAGLYGHDMENITLSKGNQILPIVIVYDASIGNITRASVIESSRLKMRAS